MFKDTLEWQTNHYLPCGHSFLEHKLMEESLASSEMEWAKTDKTICELIELSK